MEQDRKNWQINTQLNHPKKVEILDGNRPLIQPIYLSAKFTLSEDHSYMDQFLYSRLSNPTTRQLEMSLAEIQKKEDCIVMSSGMAALSGTFLGLLKAGDHIITFREIYKPARTFIKDVLTRYQIEHTILALKDLSMLESAIRDGKTKLIHFESLTNPNLEIADVEYIIKVARRHGVLVSMDGTFAGLHQHTQFDVDLMIHSLTKFGNGHGDVIAGSIAGKKSLIQELRQMGVYLGATIDAHTSYLIERGLKTYMLRFERQTSSAQKVAEFLQTHKKVKITRYPGLSQHPGHELAKKQMKDMGAVVSFEIDPSICKDAAEFCHKLSLIQFSVSLGSTESIICPTELFFAADLGSSDKSEMGINPYTVRLSVGLEDPEDIIKDLRSLLG